MKAGIYRNPNSNICAYVGKDRIIRRVSDPKFVLCGMASQRGDNAMIAGEVWEFVRSPTRDEIAGHGVDWPDKKLIVEVVEEVHHTLDSKKRGSFAKFFGLKPTRKIGKQSARKHRRKGRLVLTDNHGQRWWVPA